MDPEMPAHPLTGRRETLDAYQVEAAIQYLQEKYDLLPAEREVWGDVLVHLIPGELRSVVDKWVGRPSPEAVLDYVLTAREPQPDPEPLVPAPPGQRRMTPQIREVIDEARRALLRDTVSCAPDVPEERKETR